MLLLVLSPGLMGPDLSDAELARLIAVSGPESAQAEAALLLVGIDLGRLLEGIKNAFQSLGA